MSEMTMDEMILISVDDHFVEPPDAFLRHFPEKAKDRAPRIERHKDADVWVFSGARPLERPNTGAAIDAAARRLVAGPARFVDVTKSDTRLYGTPVVAGGRRIGTVVAAVSLAPYEQTRKTALIGSLVFGAVVLLLVGVAASWLLAASLRPVVRMTRQAAAWSERELDHRFALGPPHDELTELAANLDALLDQKMSRYPGVIRVEPWPASDHYIFYSNGTPSIALTNQGIRDIYHTLSDTFDWISGQKLAETCQLVLDLMEELDHQDLSWSRPQK